MVNEKDTIAQNFDIFCLPYRGKDGQKYFSEFSKVSISYEELWCIINNMELYLKTNINEKMKDFVELLKQCGSEKHFFEISKDELYKEIISPNFNFSDDAAHSAVINLNHDLLAQLNDDQITQLVCVLAGKDTLGSNLIIYYLEFILTHLSFISRQLPDHLLTRIAVEMMDHSNSRLLAILYDVEFNFFKNEGSIIILRKALKNSNQIQSTYNSDQMPQPVHILPEEKQEHHVYQNQIVLQYR